ncbi:Aste57867_17197 [Aphanomyces stellatus]|uniref:Aste57867_17197 protein n=1 Tax=Aphanomyces stellatus TaxID=120398 RepID=A0A485L916_9STRA|nr:hypothetical protein As57867_017138 [Aphanomyces stellatus]VFT93954.1 Aste57867_17197 [Aphanomyces stellatus]
MGRTELPIWQDFSEKYRAPHRRTPLVRCKTCGDEICASTTSLYQHKNVCGKKNRGLESIDDAAVTADGTDDLLPREPQSTRKRKEIWDDFGEKYKVDGRKTLVVNCKMCGKDVAAATTSLYQHQAVCANIDVPKQQKRPKSEPVIAKVTNALPPVEEVTMTFMSIQKNIQELRSQIETAHVDDAPALQTALDALQIMRGNILEKLSTMARGQFIV